MGNEQDNTVYYGENADVKVARSGFYNYNFDKKTGYFERWGELKSDDPQWAPSPEILDIEITTNCEGPSGKLCPFCYKSNNPNGYNMPFEHFASIIDKMPYLTQCALGADAQGKTNPDMFRMMEYARLKGIIPNLTIADVDVETAEKLAAVAGAVAVSVYRHAGKDVAYDSVARLSAAGQKQINLHLMISDKTMAFAHEVVKDIKSDERLKNLNAIVFLSLKQKGRGTKFDYVTLEQYKELVDVCMDTKVPFGFDSCSAPIFLESIKDHKDFDKLREMSEDCESTLFSAYINEKGEFFPCSFTEHWEEGGWSEGISVLDAEDFVADVWLNPKTNQFREDLLNNRDELGCRNCPAYAICGRDMRVHKEAPDVTQEAVAVEIK